jgi:hypothetical protein
VKTALSCWDGQPPSALQWSQKSGQGAKVYPALFGEIRDGETPEVYRPVQGEGRA